jgi:hypothetical protein
MFSRPERSDGLIFLGCLRRQRPHLLEFKTSGDRWQTVHGWLAGEGKNHSDYARLTGSDDNLAQLNLVLYWVL